LIHLGLAILALPAFWEHDFYPRGLPLRVLSVEVTFSGKYTRLPSWIGLLLAVENFSRSRVAELPMAYGVAAPLKLVNQQSKDKDELHILTHQQYTTCHGHASYQKCS
jgi:hypothetical protein